MWLLWTEGVCFCIEFGGSVVVVEFAVYKSYFAHSNISVMV
jgi:hypothetical protein